MTLLQALVAFPVLLPMLGAAASVIVGRHASLQRVIGVVTLAIVCVVAGILLVAADRNGPVVAELGGWPAPMGIALVADRMSALLLLISSLVTLAVLVYAIDQRISDYGRETASTTFHPIFLLLSTGVSLAYLTGDLFTLFVAFEIMLASSYVLITRRTSASRIRSGMTYVIVSLTSSLLFLTAVGFVYAATGTVNLADLAGRMELLPDGLQTVLALVLVVVFGIKAAIVPLHFWLPDSYPNAPAPVTALFAGLLTKVGIYALLRTQTLVFPQDDPSMLLLVIAAMTMVVGALGAIAQDDLNRLLSFLLVSHIGFMLFGMAVWTPEGIAGTALYVVHHITVQATLFLVSGLITRRTGTVSISQMGGLAQTAPHLAVLFAIPAITLAGLPPTSGFVAKLALLQAGAGGGLASEIVAAFVVVASLLTLYAVARVWVRVFWGTPKEPLVDNDPNDELVVGTARSARGMYVGASSLVVVSIVIALFAGPLSGITARAGEDLYGRDTYRSAVLEPVAVIPAGDTGAGAEDAGDTGAGAADAGAADAGTDDGAGGTALAELPGAGTEVTP
ncbi:MULTISPECIES: Na+/H+ antiporter subunit D [Pseudonocardia]|uniref:Na(+)/H(+) antiporter subunit D n=2 Tax=Pseudonocardia TaxID=1847 RepID=A0A1Y2MLL6_PSEAH|nr:MULTISPECIES: Na+/H+ antiporter subunit D [Pseudonocardia]OSY36173.1 Na(+)/H(+) antiporter subunit D [Pseudonocardia autotrophica]TDN76606.1 multisubunit sodium/proton antiporter MrpD subunit [Pseudonocardia autotrophica]BBG00607.1 Na+/H+ antiporter subunit D [Pseudonocardia autotrophica]GEC26991.1 Na+/H+ antiporter subunit D [Pseudonocardia saturnea]